MNGFIKVSICVLAATMAAILSSAKVRPAIGNMAEPAMGLAVVGFALLLTVLTYEPKDVLWELRKAFGVKKNQPEEGVNRRMLAQMAIYALIAGVVMAVVQLLLHLGGPHTKGDVSQVVRMSSMSLLYGVLAAVGLWAISGFDRPNEVEKGRDVVSVSRYQVITAFSILLLTVGVLSVLILSIYFTNQKERNVVREVDRVNGLILGPDYVYRVPKHGGITDPDRAPSLVDLDKRVGYSHLGKGKEDMMEVPLRWEMAAQGDLRFEDISMPVARSQSVVNF